MLKALPKAEFEQLRSDLEELPFASGDVLHEPGEEVEHTYFPLQGLISLVAVMEQGELVEVGLIGNEGMLGTPYLLGSTQTARRAIIQAPGRVYRMKAKKALRAFQQLPEFQSLVLRYVQAQSILVSQTAACNRLHEVEQRLARWLLMCQDRLGSETLPLTQEFLAQMLGVKRSTVTVVAGTLQHAGLIEYSRGRIKILKSKELEDAACECYCVVRDHFAALLDGKRS